MRHCLVRRCHYSQIRVISAFQTRSTGRRSMRWNLARSYLQIKILQRFKVEQAKRNKCQTWALSGLRRGTLGLKADVGAERSDPATPLAPSPHFGAEQCTREPTNQKKAIKKTCLEKLSLFSFKCFSAHSPNNPNVPSIPPIPPVTLPRWLTNGRAHPLSASPPSGCTKNRASPPSTSPASMRSS